MSRPGTALFALRRLADQEYGGFMKQASSHPRAATQSIPIHPCRIPAGQSPAIGFSISGSELGFLGGPRSPDRRKRSLVFHASVRLAFHGLPAAGLGFLVAMVILLAELRMRRAEISGLMGGAVGAVLGLLSALLITLVISRTAEPEPTKSFFEFTSLFAFGYSGVWWLDLARVWTFATFRFPPPSELPSPDFDFDEVAGHQRPDRRAHRRCL